MSKAYPKQTILNELVAHRGASEHAPENTMAAFNLAQQQGAQWLEFDVSTAGDSTPIIMHDATTERCGDKHFTLNELNKYNIKTIDVGAWFHDEFTGERIPLFVEVLEWLRGNNMRANVEIKRHTHQRDTAAFVQPIIKALLDYQELWPRLLVTSFDKQSLDYCMAHAPELELGSLFDELPENWLALTQHWGASTLHINYMQLSESMLIEAQRHKIVVRCYTPKSYEDVEPYLHMGLTSVIVNSPTDFNRAIGEHFKDQ